MTSHIRTMPFAQVGIPTFQSLLQLPLYTRSNFLQIVQEFTLFEIRNYL